MVNELETGHRLLRVATDGPAQSPRRLRLARLTQRLAPTPESIPVGRWLAIRACDRWGLPGAVGPAGQIVTELVGNAVEHAGTAIDLVLTYVPPKLYIAVRDRCPSLPRQRSAEPGDRRGTAGDWRDGDRRGAAGYRRGAEGLGELPSGADQGRGLLVVAAYAAEHGTTRTRDGKVVWATLRVG
jgi:hypothetical protein